MLPPPNHLSGAGTHISFSVSSGLVSARLASYDRLSAYSGIELRNPYLDRRLVDFMLNIPGRYLFRDGTSRHLQRQALKGTLPESIRNRTSKANFTKLYEIGFREKETKKIHTLISEFSYCVYWSHR